MKSIPITAGNRPARPAVAHPYILPVERIYRELAKPKAAPPPPAPLRAEVKKVLTRADVDDIIARRRSATSDELSHILANATAFSLTTGEKNQLSVDATIAMAHARRSATRRESPGEQFIAQTLGLLPTPYGLFERAFVDRTLRAGSDNIRRCRSHRPARCSCWASQRAILWEARAHGEKTPEGWASVRIFEALEQLETTSRPEVGPGRSS